MALVRITAQRATRVLTAGGSMLPRAPVSASAFGRATASSSLATADRTRSHRAGGRGAGVNANAALAALAGLGLGGAFVVAAADSGTDPLDAKATAALKKGADLHVLDSQNKVPPRPDLPTFTLEDVKKHSGPDGRTWVTFRGGVYDVTEFIPAHLGRGSRLEMAGGNDLEPFWNVYRMHFRGHIHSFLERYRVGSLSPEDAAKATTAFEFGDAFEDDPPRHPDCVTCTPKPFCGETRLDLLGESYFTPNELFYTRNHASVPRIDDEDYELVVEVPGFKTRTFTLDDLKTKFPQYDVVATIQCAGNRGEDYHGIGKGGTTGVFQAPHWNVGAISNGLWRGPRMRDILKECGVDVDALSMGTKYDPSLQHAEFESYDEDETGGRYHASVPFDKMVDAKGDCIVALELNGRTLPRDHGYPARAIVPGHAGARQPKWLHKITIKPEAAGVLQCLGFAPDITFEKDLQTWPPKMMSQSRVVQEMPVQSLVTWPPQNGTVGTQGRKTIPIKGVAWSGGGSGIHRVDVSVNGGVDFTAASMFKPVEQHRRGQWGWTMFHHEVPIPEDAQEKLARGERVTIEVTSKAVDGQYNVQPEHPGPYVNPRGVSVNHFYRVAVTLDPHLPGDMIVNPAAIASERGDLSLANTPSGGKWRTAWRNHGWSAVKPGEKPGDWVKKSTFRNTDGEPGISAKVDWAYYKGLQARPWYQGAKVGDLGDSKLKARQEAEAAALRESDKE